MADIAKLGFSVDTNDLQRASASLKAIVPPAHAAAKAADTVSASFNKVDAAAGKAADASRKTTAAASGVGGAVSNAAAAQNRAAGAADAYAAATTRAGNAAQQAVPKIARLGQAANDNLNAVQATPANIAAQFQDIGVTAAMGMNPMLIALQQGTQLSVAFSGGLGNVGAALRQVFNATSLLTIGAVGLIATLVQMVDWTELAKTALYGLADALEMAAPYIIAFVGVMALIYAPAIVTGIVAITQALWGMVAAMVAAVGWPAILVAGFLALIAAANHWRDDLTQKLGFDIVGAAKTGVNFIVGSFVGAFNAVLGTWKQLPAAIGDVVFQAANATLRGVTWLVNQTVDIINGLTSMLPFGLGDKLNMGHIGTFQMTNPFEGAASSVAQIAADAMKAAWAFDWAGASVEKAAKFGKWLADQLRSVAGSLGQEDKKDKTKKAAKGGKSDAEKFSDIMADADRQLKQLEAENKMIGVYGEALHRARYEQEMLNKAAQQGLSLGPAEIAMIKEKAAALAAQRTANEHDQFIEDMVQRADEMQRSLEVERTALGMTTQEAIAYKFATDALLEAKKKHIDLSPEEVAAIYAAGDAYAAQRVEIDRIAQAIDDSKDIARGFWQDWYNGAKQGKGIFESFADAVVNSLQRIIDKLFDRTLDQFLDGLFGGGGGGGILGSIFGAVTGSLGGGIGGDIAGLESNFDKVFGAKAFAKGDVFGSPTAFNYGGGKLGVMGEAGPEAVMPLARLPNGELGVRNAGGAANGGGTVQVVVEVVEGQMFEPRVKAISEDVSVNVTQTGIAMYDRQMPERVQAIANDERAR